MCTSVCHAVLCVCFSRLCSGPVPSLRPALALSQWLHCTAPNLAAGLTLLICLITWHTFRQRSAAFLITLCSLHHSVHLSSFCVLGQGVMVQFPSLCRFNHSVHESICDGAVSLHISLSRMSGSAHVSMSATYTVVHNEEQQLEMTFYPQQPENTCWTQPQQAVASSKHGLRASYDSDVT